ncbi:MAG: alpha/beta fold hydrolase [Bacteroidota bacterium]|nr:alpha/beta fold hydrolase [Bacteroidota bacterium]MDP4233996.1 alpha/beta fold hydrolase [Bacteroidota bacterium]MDP4242863.1 alpha/beta fold hydrolase [Bacteroidota bacterium]MDP4287699.1 alpha/beta fold hydrolase [Bacteroidota bacterium]
MEILEQFVNNNGVQIHTLEFNPTAAGLPLIMVPGMANAAEEIAETVGPLLTRRTVALSIRGRGKSDSPATGWRLEDQASDIAAVVKHFGFPKIALFGHSTGGSIAARALPMLNAEVAAFFIGDFAPFYPPYDEGWRQHVKQFPDLAISDVALAGIVAEPEYIDVSEYLKPVASLFAMTGDLDKSLLQAEELAGLQKLFPRITIERLEGCSHEFLADDPTHSVLAIERCLANM